MKENKLLIIKESHPEADYIELVQLGAKLGIPVPQVHLKLIVSKDGKIISSYQQRSRTWNRNFWNSILGTITRSDGVVTNFGAGYLSLKNTAAAVPAIGPTGWLGNNAGQVNTSTFGIIVGVGAGAESFEGYVLTTPCANGTGVNQLVYSAHSALVQNYVAGTKTWTVTIKRIMNNNSAADILLTEMALGVSSAVNATIAMLNRDLLAETENVPVGTQLTASYDISLTFPA